MSGRIKKFQAVKHIRLTAVCFSAKIVTMKDFRYPQLLDVYQALLTENQRDVCEQYYMYDLSLSEIAEQKGVSRQSVSDTLAKSRAVLDDCENRLHFLEQSRETEERIRSRLEKIRAALAALRESEPSLAAEIGRIMALTETGDL